MQLSGDLTRTDYQALSDLRYQLRRYLTFSDQAATAAGLQPQQHQLLLTIRGAANGENATVGYIAERLQVRHHSAVELTNRAAARGLVLRRRDTFDRRKVVIEITRRGDAVLRKLTVAHRKELGSIGPVLNRALQHLLVVTENEKQTQTPRRT